MIAFPRRAEAQYHNFISESSDSMIVNAYMIKRLPVSKLTESKQLLHVHVRSDGHLSITVTQILQLDLRVP